MKSKTLEDYKYEMMECFRCSHCKFVPWPVLRSKRFSQICPSISRFNFHAYSGSGKVEMALSFYTGRLKEWTRRMLHIIYSCTYCGACAISCRINNYLIDLYGILETLKHKAVLDGVGPLPQHKTYTQYIKDVHNPYNEPHENRFNWLPTDVKITEDADLIYWVGCTSSYRRTEIAQATARVLNKIGVDFRVLRDEEICCGSPVYMTGQKELAKEMAQQVVDKIKKSGATKVLTACAGCYGMFKAKYPNLLDKVPFEVISLAELLDEKLQAGEIKFTRNLPMKVTYHDPCHLGRMSEFIPEWEGEWKLIGPHMYAPIPEKPTRLGLGGCYDPPRRVLKAIPGIEFVEMERIRERAWCCGAGAGCKAAYPDFALWTASERLEEAKSTGANVLVSACPFCATNLKDAIVKNQETLKFYDIAELAFMALEGDEA